MKKLAIFPIIILFVFSCKEKKDDSLNSLLKQRSDLTKETDALDKKMNALNTKINLIQKIDNTTLVTPITIAYQPFQHFIDLQSTVTTDQDVSIYPEFSGIIQWTIQEGSRVTKGQVIASINDGGLSQQIAQARIQADMAKTTFDKQARLWNQQIGSEIQYLQAKTASESAQKQIAALEMQLGRTKIKAPFSGVIDQLMIQSGQVVTPGIPLAKLISLSNMKVVADISEKFLDKVKLGTTVDISLPDINKTMQSKISRVSNFINPNNRSFSVEIPVNNAGNMIKPNMTAQLHIIDYKNANAISVPTSIIKLNAENQTYLYTITQINGKMGVVDKRMITTGMSNGENTEVLSGIKVGDIIIADGGSNVTQGVKIKF